MSEREHEERERIDEGMDKSYEGPSDPPESDTTPSADQEIDTGDDAGSDDG